MAVTADSIHRSLTVAYAATDVATDVADCEVITRRGGYVVAMPDSLNSRSARSLALRIGAFVLGAFGSDPESGDVNVRVTSDWRGYPVVLVVDVGR